jgi:S1-C subfamily serine protease
LNTLPGWPVEARLAPSASPSNTSAERVDQLRFRDHFKGVLVVRSEGLGSLAGLRPGTVITKVDDKAVGSAKEAADAVGKGSLEKGILMQVRSAHGGTAVVMIRADAD